MCSSDLWDAVSNDTLAIQALLRGSGFRSEIFAEHIDPSLADRVTPIGRLADPTFADDAVLIHVCYRVGLSLFLEIRMNVRLSVTF